MMTCPPKFKKWDIYWKFKRGTMTNARERLPIKEDLGPSLSASNKAWNCCHSQRFIALLFGTSVRGPGWQLLSLKFIPSRSRAEFSCHR
jgi:hypothetical protein